MYGKLKESDIKELIRMVGVVHEKANAEIIPVLNKLLNDKKIELTKSEKETLDTWSKIEDLKTDDKYKAAKPFVWIIKKWFKQ